VRNARVVLYWCVKLLTLFLLLTKTLILCSTAKASPTASPRKSQRALKKNSGQTSDSISARMLCKILGHHQDNHHLHEPKEFHGDAMDYGICHVFCAHSCILHVRDTCHQVYEQSRSCMAPLRSSHHLRRIHHRICYRPSARPRG
jgi:hypothetical protein